MDTDLQPQDEEVSLRRDDPEFISVNQCGRCTRVYFTPFGACEAFPNGIPDVILFGAIRHDKPYPGDHGLQFTSPESSPPEDS